MNVVATARPAASEIKHHIPWDTLLNLSATYLENEVECLLLRQESALKVAQVDDGSVAVDGRDRQDQGVNVIVRKPCAVRDAPPPFPVKQR